MATRGIDYGMTPAGFISKRLADIVAGIDAKLAALGIQVDSNDGTIIANIRGPVAEAISEAWQEAAAAALQFDPRYNSGQGQSGTVQINGIIRRAGYPAKIPITCTGVEGTVILAGSLIATVDGLNRFSIDTSLTIGAGLTVTGTATCTEKGISSVGAAEVIAILTPISGWTGVTNSVIAVQGAAEETDAQLRERQQTETALTSKCQVEAILDAVTNVVGVTYCRVYVNNTLVTDTNGIPAISIAVVVVGGIDADVAAAIWAAAPAGLRYDSNANTTVTETDAQGGTYAVKFWRPTPVAIDVVVDITQTDVTLPLTYANDIKQAIVDYSTRGGAALDSDRFDRDGFPPGQSVILSQLYTPINSVPGFSITSLEICIHAGSPTAADVTINWNKVATFSLNNITVNKA